jgi:hypothetical protein
MRRMDGVTSFSPTNSTQPKWADIEALDSDKRRMQTSVEC